jgi:hypothetical protein
MCGLTSGKQANLLSTSSSADRHRVALLLQMSKLSVLVLLVVAVLAATAAQTNGPKRIRVGLRHQNYAEFDKLFWDITSPTSKNYGKYEAP